MKAILLTRTPDDNAALEQILSAKGYRCFSAPVLRIAPVLPTPELPHQADLVIATSRHALPSALPDALRAKPLWVVGEQTRKRAKICEWQSEIHCFETAATLLNALQEAITTEADILYLRGQHIATDLAAACPNHHWQQVIMYHAEPINTLPDSVLSALASQKISHTLLFSRRAARQCEYLLEQKQHTATLTALCLSVPVAESLNTALWKSIRVAAHPTTANLLECLYESDTAEG